MSEKRFWVLPFVWLELPCLSGRQYADYSGPWRQIECSESTGNTYQAS